MSLRIWPPNSKGSWSKDPTGVQQIFKSLAPEDTAFAYQFPTTRARCSPNCSGLGQPGIAFGLTGSSPLNRATAALTASSSAELSDGPVRLGQLVGLDALDALGPAGTDQGLTLPTDRGSLRRPQLLRKRAHLLAGHQSLTGGPAELSRILLRLDYLLVAHDPTRASPAGSGSGV